jgi:hypothetical protein
MKWDCGPTWKEKIAAWEQWHPHFAVWPVRVGSHDCRWLEWVERKADFSGYGGDVYWEYRA